MSTIENAHLAGLIAFPVLTVLALGLIVYRFARGEELFRKLRCHPHSILHPISLFRSDDMKAKGMMHVPQFLAMWERYRALYMGVVAYFIIMTFYYAVLWLSGGIGLRPSGELVDFGRWIAYTIVANIAMTVLCHVLYVHKGQYYYVRLFGTLAPVCLLFSTFVVTRNEVVTLFVLSAISTAVAFLCVLPSNYIGRYKHSNKARTWANKYFWFGMSILGAYLVLGLIFLLVEAHLITSALKPDGEAVANVIADIVIAVYVLVMVSVKFFTDKLEVYTGKLTADHFNPTQEYNEEDEKIPIFPIIDNDLVPLEPAPVAGRPSASPSLSAQSYPLKRNRGMPSLFSQ